MRKLLNTLYITTEDLFLSCSNENVVVSRKDEVLSRFPLQNLEGIVTLSYAGAWPLSKVSNQGAVMVGNCCCPPRRRWGKLK